MKIPIILASLLCLSACATPNSEPAIKISSQVLLESTKSWDGEAFAYPAGEAQLTITRIIIPKGLSLPMHCHPIPLGGYLVQGRLEVKKESGQTFILEKDEPLIEVSNQWHFGRAMEDTEILVVYSGAKEVPVTVLKDGDPEFVALCR